jgi:hypothetical protein
MLPLVGIKDNQSLSLKPEIPEDPEVPLDPEAPEDPDEPLVPAEPLDPEEPEVPLDPDKPLVPEDPDVPSDPPATRTSQLVMSLGGGGEPIGMLNIFVCTVYVMFKYKTESPL